MWHDLSSDLGQPLFVRGVHRRVQERYSDGFDIRLAQRSEHQSCRNFVQRHPDCAIRQATFPHLVAQAPWHERRRKHRRQVAVVVAVLAPNLEDVAKAFGGHQCRPRARPFDYGVGGKGGRVDENMDCLRTDP